MVFPGLGVGCGFTPESGASTGSGIEGWGSTGVGSSGSGETEGDGVGPVFVG